MGPMSRSRLGCNRQNEFEVLLYHKYRACVQSPKETACGERNHSKTRTIESTQLASGLGTWPMDLNRGAKKRNKLDDKAKKQSLEGK